MFYMFFNEIELILNPFTSRYVFVLYSYTFTVITFFDKYSLYY